MSENQYLTVAGFVQKFGKDKPAIVERDVNGSTIREFTVKAIGTQKLVRVTLWPEFAHATVDEGYFVVADGKLKVNESNGTTYYNISASKFIAAPSIAPQERETVNQQSAAAPASTATSDDSPF